MGLRRAQNGTWSLTSEAETRIQEQSHPSYLEALPRYLSTFDLAFAKAHEASEYALIETLLGVRGMQDAGWDPYESSLEAIEQMRTIHAKIKTESYNAARHLELWIYGHIVEASEPYEILANLIDISQGGAFHIQRFPPRPNGAPQSPGSKISQLEKAAIAANLASITTPLREVWDRDLRNSIFHSDYALHGGEVRFRNGDGRPSVYGHDQILTLVNRALAYFDALRALRIFCLGSYTEPKEIPVHPKNAGSPNERAIVMVREGHGAIGLKSAWTVEEMRLGHFHWHFGVFTQEESELVRADPMRAMFPPKTRPKIDPPDPSQQIS